MSINTYREMLTYRRPMGSLTEHEFIKRYISNLPGAFRDPYLNWHVVTDPTSPILWCAHTDTVHHKAGRQTVHVNRATMEIGLSKRSRMGESNCLGADDTTGVYLLREMILAGMPGHYIFHYGEERGGIGSRALAVNDPEFLKRFTYAIALDRGGYGDVITHQSWSRTSSDAFALSFIDALGIERYKPSDNGMYTDTAEYAELIPECSNVSVGYEGAHSRLEIQSIVHLEQLRDALLKMDVSKLVSERDPSVPESSMYDNWFGRPSTYIDDSAYDLCPLCREYEALCTCDKDDKEAYTADFPDDTYLDPEFAAVQRALTPDPKPRSRRYEDFPCDTCGLTCDPYAHRCGAWRIDGGLS